MPLQVTLTPDEVYLAALTGIRRRVDSQRINLNDWAGRNDISPNRWDDEIEGASGEVAVAKAFGMYWDGSVNNFHNRPDLGPHEVRTTTLSDGSLIYRRHEPPDLKYILVVGRSPVYTIIGWLTGHEAMANDQWLRNPGGRRPAWFVPQHALHPVHAATPTVLEQL